jgi:hypothetical protein
VTVNRRVILAASSSLRRGDWPLAGSADWRAPDARRRPRADGATNHAAPRRAVEGAGRVWRPAGTMTSPGPPEPQVPHAGLCRADIRARRGSCERHRPLEHLDATDDSSRRAMLPSVSSQHRVEFPRASDTSPRRADSEAPGSSAPRRSGRNRAPGSRLADGSGASGLPDYDRRGVGEIGEGHRMTRFEPRDVPTTFLRFS